MLGVAGVAKRFYSVSRKVLWSSGIEAIRPFIGICGEADWLLVLIPPPYLDSGCRISESAIPFVCTSSCGTTFVY
ncbi:hypothetical protein HPP92_015908 [Vanilla planifolia]|uniref:Uncharacterized protein n=1 Tax=Vanilla planifolia TaxID=51239 RepID=A0A835QM29_VANPL|nr:hypothetical protein HPP92_015908 [Vanilla planifolia]